MAYATVCRVMIKTKEGKQHPIAMLSFATFNASRASCSEPRLAGDFGRNKKKELVGNYGKSGQNGSRKANLSRSMCMISPTRISQGGSPWCLRSGINLGWVAVGCSHDAAHCRGKHSPLAARDAGHSRCDASGIREGVDLCR